jgi:hypothetical protein
MDTLFGSVGTAEREKERWAEVHREVGLTEILERAGVYHDSGAADYHKEKGSMEKPEVVEHA